MILGIKPFAISIGTDVDRIELEKLTIWDAAKPIATEAAIHTLFQAMTSNELTNTFFMGGITLSLCNYARQCESGNSNYFIYFLIFFNATFAMIFFLIPIYSFFQIWKKTEMYLQVSLKFCLSILIV